MDALVCIRPGELSLQEGPVPVCAPGEALARPRRIGICGTDYHIYQGKHPFLKYPIVMGHELAAEVCEAPPGSALTAAVAQFPAKIGELGSDTLVKAINGEKVEANVDTGAGLVTASNVKDF